LGQAYVNAGRYEKAIPALKNVLTYDRGPLADLSEHERIWVGGRQSTIFILTII